MGSEMCIRDRRFAERQKQIDLAKARGVEHMASSLEDAKQRKAQQRARLKALSDQGQARTEKK